MDTFFRLTSASAEETDGVAQPSISAAIDYDNGFGGSVRLKLAGRGVLKWKPIISESSTV